VDFGLSLQDAIDAPRCFSDDGGLKVEKRYTDEVREELADLGHNVYVPPVGIGGAQFIQIDHDRGTLEGASDPRKDGCALGYEKGMRGLESRPISADDRERGKERCPSDPLRTWSRTQKQRSRR